MQNPEKHAIVALAALLFVTLPGCKRQQSTQGPPEKDTPGAATSLAQPVVTPPGPPAQAPQTTPLPMGPALLVIAGQGLGPIRFGATRATIERLMEAPCDGPDLEHCRYVQRGVEFFLKEGVLIGIQVNAWLRSVKGTSEQRWGMFNGFIPPDLKLGMLPWAIEEKLGKATRVETLPDPGGPGPLERHHYAGMVLEYDRIENGKPVLAGIWLERPTKSR